MPVAASLLQWQCCNCERDLMAHKGENIYSLASHRKSLPIIYSQPVSLPHVWKKKVGNQYNFMFDYKKDSCTGLFVCLFTSCYILFLDNITQGLGVIHVCVSQPLVEDWLWVNEYR